MAILKKLKLFFSFNIFVYLLTSCFNQVLVDPMGAANQNQPLVRELVYSDHLYTSSQRLTYNPNESSKILMIPIEGIISADTSLRRSNANPALVKEALDKAILEKDYKAIIIKIDSPGGTVHASDSIYKMIIRFRDYTRLPVYAHIEGMGASGGYYVAMASNYVNASPASMVGSIGVILKKYTVTGLMEKVGIDYNSIKSGPNKDILTPERPLTAQEEAILQEQILESYNSFLMVIQKSRVGKLENAILKESADGRVFTASQAKNKNLIDSTMYFEDFIDYIKVTEKLNLIKVYAYLPRNRQKYNLYNTSAIYSEDPTQLLQNFADGKRNGLYYFHE